MAIMIHGLELMFQQIINNLVKIYWLYSKFNPVHLEIKKKFYQATTKNKFCCKHQTAPVIQN